MSPPRSLSHCSTDLCKLVIAFHVYLGVKDFCDCTCWSIRTDLLAADSIGSFFFRWSSFSFHVFNLLPTSKNFWHCHLSFHFEFFSVRYSRNDWIIAAGYVVRYSLTFSSRDSTGLGGVSSSSILFCTILTLPTLSSPKPSIGCPWDVPLFLSALCFGSSNSIHGIICKSKSLYTLFTFLSALSKLCSFRSVMYDTSSSFNILMNPLLCSIFMLSSDDHVSLMIENASHTQSSSADIHRWKYSACVSAGIFMNLAELVMFLLTILRDAIVALLWINVQKTARLFSSGMGVILFIWARIHTNNLAVSCVLPYLVG